MEFEWEFFTGIEDGSAVFSDLIWQNHSVEDVLPEEIRVLVKSFGPGSNDAARKREKKGESKAGARRCRLRCI